MATTLLRRVMAAAMVALATLATSVGAVAAPAAENVADAAPPSADVAALETATAQVEALVAGHLDASVPAPSLFEVRLDDEAAVQVDAARLRALLRTVTEPLADAGVIDAKLWRARLGLDCARLAFYELPPADRTARLAANLRAARDAGALSTADRREDEAAAQRKAALIDARTARTEAERLVATELARLLDVERAQSDFAAGLAHDRADNAHSDDATLGWRRRTLDARTGGDAASADRTYDDLRRALGAARDSLSTALAELSDPPHDVPEPGADPLAALSVDVDTTAVRAERDRLEAEGNRLVVEDAAVRRERAARLFAAIDSLNADRLALLPALTPAKRAQVTGFTLDGWEQAAAEVRQLTLVVRYHRHIIGEWLGQLRHPDRALESTLAGGAFPLIELLAAVFLFLWWRRRSTRLLVTLRKRLEEGDGRSRLEAPSPATRALVFLT